MVRYARFGTQSEPILFGCHFKLRDYSFRQLHKELADRSWGVTKRWTDSQENGNLPRGPEEISEQWRAQSRLQYAVHGIYAWGAHCPPNGIFIVHLTRVQDKGSDFTAMVMEHALDYLQSRGILGSKPGPRGGWPAPT